MRQRRGRRRVGHAARPFGMDDHDEMTGALPWADIEEQEARSRAIAKVLVEALASGPDAVRGAMSRPSGPPMWPPMSVQISQAEQDHHAFLRRRSAELAVERGHVRRWTR
ncbi:hypothetical protein [Actinomycetospora termitidis]|uniref:Uncharacterized protein n=1 Tax=Actinomycetospora termitidis TaxID=3053470 RepID=A0ABT7MGX4_9PSEU|nr:hypothetical protein [Actinomycetospora sp. Odt1-22]MDL5159419.1 hypothetical protein [Actinomycetospora sp. Odt1-22]